MIPLRGSSLVALTGRLLALSLIVGVILARLSLVLIVAWLLIHWLMPIVHGCLSCPYYCFCNCYRREPYMGNAFCYGKMDKNKKNPCSLGRSREG